MLQNFTVLLVTDTEILRNNTDIYGIFFTNFVKKSLRYALFSNFIIEKRRVTQRATANIMFCNSPFGAKKWGVSFCFRTLSLLEKVQISFMQTEIIAKLLPAALFAQNMCS